MTNSKVSMDEIVNLAKRRGFVYPGSDIYGGSANTWDYGPYGVLLKNNVKTAWWQDMVMKRMDVVGLDAAILMNPKVWEASGHLGNFTDPLVECKNCQARFRQDQLEGENCPTCGKSDWGEPRNFNLMFKTFAGPVEDTASTIYLRPETAQGMFVNFKNILDTTRVKLPFGIAQIGKSFRNEITPGNFTFRTREFEQFEMEYFCKNADEAKQVYDMWLKERRDWYLKLGIRKENLNFRVHEEDELAHYAVAACDVEYNFPFGWSELEGIANRGTYDLAAHEEASGEELRYFDDETKEKILPHVVEPAGGVDRATLAFFVDAYTKEQVGDGDERTVLKLHPKLAPIKVAIFPLVKKDPLLTVAKDLTGRLKEKFFVEYDESGTVGKRYRRQDEIGTPFCITVDFDGVESTPQTVTVRHRDSMEQERIEVEKLEDWLDSRIN